MGQCEMGTSPTSMTWHVQWVPSGDSRSRGDRKHLPCLALPSGTLQMGRLKSGSGWIPLAPLRRCPSRFFRNSGAETATKAGEMGTY